VRELQLGCGTSGWWRSAMTGLYIPALGGTPLGLLLMLFQCLRGDRLHWLNIRVRDDPVNIGRKDADVATPSTAATRGYAAAAAVNLRLLASALHQPAQLSAIRFVPQACNHQWSGRLLVAQMSAGAG